MRPTFLAFHTAHRALAASQANIDVVGNNISNVNTAGYTRQRVDLNSISNTATGQRYIAHGPQIGHGVEVSNFSQIRDPFLDARYRNEASENGKFNTILAGLADLERVLDEVDTLGLQNEISNFVNQLQTLSQTPTSKDLSLIVRTAAQKVTQIMNVYSNQINEVRDQQIFDLKDVVIENQFNSLVKNIALLNTQIREELTHGNTPNELYDQRNMLIDELSSIANIKVTITPEKISEDLTIENLSISLYDTNFGGNTLGLVQGGLFNTLTVVGGDNGTQARIEVNSSFGAPPDKDVTELITGGSIRGYLDLINGKGVYADTSSKENEFRGTLYYLNAMNTFAKNFAQVFNELNAIATPPPDTKDLFTSSDGISPITAGNIIISTKWLEDPTYITTTGGNSGPGSSDNVLRMIEAVTNKRDFLIDPNDNDSGKMFHGNFAEYLTGMTGELALDIDLNKNFANTSDSVLGNLFVSREAMSGVNLDEEGINLMAFQKSYNAAARYFTALDEAVDTIINRMGLVGR
jgi:flagellar hook-associated protein 1 FlgK